MWTIQQIANSHNFVDEMVGFKFPPLVVSDDCQLLAVSEILGLLASKSNFTVEYQEDEVM